MKKPVILGLATLGSVKSVLAHCPVCTAATGAAVAVARFYGVPDSIVGVFIGSFVISTGLWMNRWLKNLKKEYFALQGQVLALASLVLTVVSLQVAGLFTGSTLLMLPGLLTGILVGSFTSVTCFSLHSFLRGRANNTNILPFQGVIAVLVSMLAGVLVVEIAMQI